MSLDALNAIYVLILTIIIRRLILHSQFTCSFFLPIFTLHSHVWLQIGLVLEHLAAKAKIVTLEHIMLVLREQWRELIGR